MQRKAPPAGTNAANAVRSGGRELLQAGGENRTRIHGMGSHCTATVLRPRCHSPWEAEALPPATPTARRLNVSRVACQSSPSPGRHTFAVVALTPAPPVDAGAGRVRCGVVA